VAGSGFLESSENNEKANDGAGVTEREKPVEPSEGTDDDEKSESVPKRGACASDVNEEELSVPALTVSFDFERVLPSDVHDVASEVGKSKLNESGAASEDKELKVVNEAVSEKDPKGC